MQFLSCLRITNILILVKINRYTNLFGNSTFHWSLFHRLWAFLSLWSPSSWITCVLQEYPWWCGQRVVLQDTSHVGTTLAPRTLPCGCSFLKLARLRAVPAAPSFCMGRRHCTPAGAWLPTHVAWSGEGCGRGAALHRHGKRQHHMTLVSRDGPSANWITASNYMSLWQALVMTHSHWTASIASMINTWYSTALLWKYMTSSTLL
jgi:hypothetical protein